MDRPIRTGVEVRLRGEPTDVGETEFPIADQDLETADSEQGLRLARRHLRRMLPQGIQSGQQLFRLDGSPADKSTWTALLTVTVHDTDHLAVAGAVVIGAWSGIAAGSGV